MNTITWKRISLYFTICIWLLSSAAGHLWNDVEIFCNLEKYKVKIDREGCAKEQYFPVKACLGNCRSLEKPLQDVPFFRSACQMCKATKINKLRFTLDNCDTGIDNIVFIDSAVQCACRTSKCA